MVTEMGDPDFQSRQGNKYSLWCCTSSVRPSGIHTSLSTICTMLIYLLQRAATCSGHISWPFSSFNQDLHLLCSTVTNKLISRSYLLRMKSVSDERCRENQNAHFGFNNFIFESLAGYEIMWQNVVVRGRPQMTILRMSFAWWVTKVTNTHSQYVIIIAFPL